MASQATLRELWLQGPEERLCGREQAKAWALREVWLAEGKGAYGLCTFVASKVRKTKNGKPTGPRPSSAAMKEFFWRRWTVTPTGSLASTLRSRGALSVCSVAQSSAPWWQQRSD